ncbi:MAG: TolC family protein, partial [Pseudomonadota bacterium]|nr:TolC family protein [Pseudomonadota bacterium]
VLLTRPDIRQAEYELLSSNADIGAARAAFFPSITLTGTYGFASQDLGQLFASGASGAWAFLPQITLPIFQGGRNQANLDLAEIRKEKAVVNYEQAIQIAFREVSDELAARETLDAQLKAQRRLVGAAQKVYDISNARYKSGIDSFLSVLDSQRELYTFQQQEIQIERQRLANLVNLYKVLGGGTDYTSE